MNEAALTPRVKHQLGVLRGSGHRVAEGARILDLGCGEGNSVRALREAGYDAWGCDVALWKSPRARELIDAGFVKPISMQPYRLPFDDGAFDFVLSAEVLEHVMNYPEFIAENRRVLEPGGVSLHIFPGPWTPIEMHSLVPLASIHRSMPWLLMWALLGVRNKFQKGYTALETARRNERFLREQTNYLTTREVRRLFGKAFGVVEFREDVFLRLAVSPHARRLNRLVEWLPFLLPVYRNLHNRVLIARD